MRQRIVIILQQEKEKYYLLIICYVNFYILFLKLQKLKTTSSFNFENNTSLSRQAFDYRENTVPFRFYVNLYNKVQKLNKTLMKIDDKNPLFQQLIEHLIILIL